MELRSRSPSASCTLLPDKVHPEVMPLCIWIMDLGAADLFNFIKQRHLVDAITRRLDPILPAPTGYDIVNCRN